ncbi:MAG: ATP-binding cassette domain-containing protein [Negativicutes bacterium]|nr:ATP-binding cassette domain-containing protein [Negativicutes bacterium]
MPVLQDMSLTIQGGEFIVILGPNGAGKSTFLKLLLGLVRPNAGGSVQVLGSTPQRGNQAIGYAPQHRALDTELPLRARDLVGFGLDGHRWGTGWPSRSRHERIEKALLEVDALNLADAPVGRLSGGEQQRLLIAQALLTDPKLLLLDEPLANLDLTHQQEVVALVSHLNRVHGVTVLLVAHDINPLLQVTDRVLYIAHGHSCLGAPHEIITSETLSNLYGSPVEVIQAEGRFFVVGAEI